MAPVQGGQESRLAVSLAAYVRPPENQNADTLNLAQRGERMLSDLRRLVRADPTFGGRAVTHIAQSRLMPGASNDGSFDDVGAYVVQPVQVVVYWTDPDDIDTAIEAIVRACKGIRKSAGYKHSVKYVSRRMTDPDELPSDQVPAVWVVRDPGPSEGLVFQDTQ
jgi:hypothetical protein